MRSSWGQGAREQVEVGPSPLRGPRGAAPILQGPSHQRPRSPTSRAANGLGFSVLRVPPDPTPRRGPCPARTGGQRQGTQIMPAGESPGGTRLALQGGSPEQAPCLGLCGVRRSLLKGVEEGQLDSWSAGGGSGGGHARGAGWGGGCRASCWVGRGSGGWPGRLAPSCLASGLCLLSWVGALEQIVRPLATGLPFQCDQQKSQVAAAHGPARVPHSAEGDRTAPMG